MNRRDALKLALAILDSFKEAGQIYLDYQADEGYTDDQYEDMLEELRTIQADQGLDTPPAPG